MQKQKKNLRKCDDIILASELCMSSFISQTYFVEMFDRTFWSMEVNPGMAIDVLFHFFFANF